jgi:hypothetical protein
LASVENATVVTIPSCALKVAISLIYSKFHNFMVWSLLADSSNFPFREKAIYFTGFSCA